MIHAPGQLLARNLSSRSCNKRTDGQKKPLCSELAAAGGNVSCKPKGHRLDVGTLTGLKRSYVHPSHGLAILNIDGSSNEESIVVYRIHVSNFIGTSGIAWVHLQEGVAVADSSLSRTTNTKQTHVYICIHYMYTLYVYVCLSIYRSIYLPIYFHTSIYLSICLAIGLSIYLSIYLYIYIYFHKRMYIYIYICTYCRYCL